MGLTLYGEIRHPTSAWEDLLERSTSPVSRRQQTKDIWQKMQSWTSECWKYAWICVIYVWRMLTKQTFLTQTGPGIKRPVLHFQGRTIWKANSAGDLHAIKQRSAGTAGKQKQKNQKYLENTNLSNGSAITPTRAQKVTTGKEPQRQICRGTRENLKILQGILANTAMETDPT